MVGVKMGKNKTIDMTKKLQNLLKVRKTPIVVIKQGSIKNKSRNSRSSSVESYSYSSYYT
jgi:hypothetical protein